MLVLKDIHKSYGKYEVLKGINLTLPNQGLVMILGESGSGKTTLFNLIALLDKPDQGLIKYGYDIITNYNELQKANYRKFNCAIIYQKYHLIPYLSVEDNIKLPLWIQNRNQEIKDHLFILNLENKLKRFPYELSGGEQQRVALARALSSNTAIILADEPTGALDSYNANIIMQILKQSAESKLVLVVTHNQKLAREYGDKIIELQNGKIKSDTNLKPINNHSVFTEKRPQHSINLKYLLSWTKKAVLHKKGKYIGSLLCYVFCLTGIMLVMGLGSGLKQYCQELITRRVDHDYLTIYTVRDGELVSLDPRINAVLQDSQENLDIITNYDYLLSQLVLLGVPSGWYYEIKVVDNIENACVNELFYKNNPYQETTLYLDGPIKVPYLAENSYEKLQIQLTFPISETKYEGSIYNVAKIYLPRQKVIELLKNYQLPLISEKLGKKVNLYEYIEEYAGTNIPLPTEVRVEGEVTKAKLIKELSAIEGVYPQYTTTDIGDNYSLIISGDEMLRGTFKDLIENGELVLLLFLLTLVISIVSLITLLLYYSIKEREKEFGVIRSFGGSTYDIYKLIALEDGFFSLVSFMLALMLVFFLKIILYYYSNRIFLEPYHLDIIDIKCIHILGTFLILVFVFILSAISPIVKSSKTNIVQVVQDD